MKALTLTIAVIVWFAATIFGAVPGRAPALPPAFLEATDSEGNPIITPAQRAYLLSLNEHLRELLAGVLENEIITEPGHMATILALELRPQQMELLLQDNCVLCHTDPEVQASKDLFTLSTGPAGGHMNLRQFVTGTHFRRGLSCAGCHGGDPRAEFGHDFVKEWPATGRDANRGWVVDFCARCHSDPGFMTRFNPGLPTDQREKFRTSRHGRLLLESEESRAPDCISCHSVHGIFPGKDPRSKVYPRRVPETCGSCHSDEQHMAGFTLADGSPMPTNQLAEYRTSVHGIALLQRGDLGSPACNDCHGDHAARPSDVTEVSRSCSLCHSTAMSLFDGSAHRRAFERNNWPECGQCHGNHAIVRPDDRTLGTGPGSWCVDCHREYAPDNPECNATAEHFHKTILAMAADRERFTHVSEQLAAKGLDVDPLENQLRELFEQLNKSRTWIHSFDRNTFDQVANKGQEAVSTLSSLVEEAEAEYRVRQVGLAASIAAIGLLMLAIYLKLQQLER
jgi:hypothetical protein